MNLIDAIFEMLGDLSQLQFFVYLWLLISIFATFVNNLDRKRVGTLTFYFTLSFVILAIASHWRLKNVVRMDPVPIEPTALIFLTFLFTGAGVWTAFFMSNITKKPKGWIYLKSAQWLLRFADYVESVLMSKLRELADWIASKEKTSNSLSKLVEKLEIDNRSS